MDVFDKLNKYLQKMNTEEPETYIYNKSSEGFYHICSQTVSFGSFDIDIILKTDNKQELEEFLNKELSITEEQNCANIK